MKRNVFGKSREIGIDSERRVTIPGPLLDFMLLDRAKDRDVVLIGMGSYVTMHSGMRYNEMAAKDESWFDSDLGYIEDQSHTSRSKIGHAGELCETSGKYECLSCRVSGKTHVRKVLEGRQFPSCKKSAGEVLWRLISVAEAED